MIPVPKNRRPRSTPQTELGSRLGSRSNHHRDLNQFNPITDVGRQTLFKGIISLRLWHPVSNHILHKVDPRVGRKGGW